MADAHTQQRHLRFFNDILAETEIIRLIWPPRPRRNHNSIELFFLQLIPGNLVILHDEGWLLANFGKEMNKIISKRVVVIYDDQSHAAPDREKFTYDNQRSRS